MPVHAVLYTLRVQVRTKRGQRIYRSRWQAQWL